MEKMAHDKSLRVMVFCTSDQQTNPRDVSFPYLSEVRVNGGVIMANLRGLKGKAGSTRPVDITEMLRMNPVKYANKVELIYAATDKERTPIFLSQLSQFGTKSCHKLPYFLLRAILHVTGTNFILEVLFHDLYSEYGASH
jgi:hypothetical protein